MPIINTKVSFGNDPKNDFTNKKVKKWVVADINIKQNYGTGLVAFELKNELGEVIQTRYFDIDGGSDLSSVVFEKEQFKLKLTFADGHDVICDLSGIKTEIAEEIATETSRAETAEDALNTRITNTINLIAAERARAEQAEATVGSRVTAEETRANNAETSLGNRISIFEISKADYDLAVEKAHTHANQTILDSVTEDSLLDSEQIRQINTISEKADVTDLEAIEEGIDAETTRAQEAESNLAARIDALEGRGRYLSGWDMSTGLPDDDPADTVYEYRSGDYYIISVVPAEGPRYRPSGASYTQGVASTVEETETDIAVDDQYFFDGTNWTIIRTATKQVSFSQIIGNPTDNTALASEFNDINNNINTLTEEIVDAKTTFTTVRTATGLDQPFELGRNTSTTFAINNLSHLTLSFPETISQGFIAEVTVKGYLHESVTIIPPTDLDIIYVKFGRRIEELELDNAAYNNLLFYHDGLNLICYISIVEY